MLLLLTAAAALLHFDRVRAETGLSSSAVAEASAKTALPICARKASDGVGAGGSRAYGDTFRRPALRLPLPLLHRALPPEDFAPGSCGSSAFVSIASDESATGLCRATLVEPPRECGWGGCAI